MENKLEKQMQAITRIAKAINEKYFNNELPSIAITIQGGRAGLEHTYGWFWAERWVSKNEKIHELNITAENMTDFLQLVITTHHELIHLYARIKGIQDTSRQGRYHNKSFAKLCDQFGLGRSVEPKIGVTTRPDDQSPVYKEWVTGLLKDEIVDKWLSSGDVFKRLPPDSAGKEKKKTKVTCQCDECGEKVQLKVSLLEDMAYWTCPYCEHQNPSEGILDEEEE